MDLKKPASLQEQLELIKDRGCVVEDDEYVLKVLSDINYYRLSAYFLPFKSEDNVYRVNTSFNTIIEIYEFDRKLRNILFALMEGLETRLRTRIAYLHAHQYGALAYLNKDTFNGNHKPEIFLDHLQGIINKNKNTPIVLHHQSKYNGQFPIWVIIELFTFGMLSKFYSDMKRKDQKEIARSTFGRSDTELGSWLFCLTNLRNACAHYSRLYYWEFPAQPAQMKDLGYTLNKRIFDYILVVKALCKGTSHWNAFFPEFLELMESSSICLEHIGFPYNWRDYLCPH